MLSGLSELEWEAAWKFIEPRLKALGPDCPKSYYVDFAGPIPTFAEWKDAVIAEGKNRQFINYVYTGKRCSLRQGVQKVIQEMKDGYFQLDPTILGGTAGEEQKPD